jgi:UDP-2,3-diacylglucosamine hydrolase
MTATVLPFQAVDAPENWRTVDFISDLHLQEKDAATFELWQSYMLQTTADAVFILGDLFEVWVGDDAALNNEFLSRCQSVLKMAASKRYVAFMRGNRDFLVGSEFLKGCHVHDLQDPTLLHFGQQTWLMCHGDEGCLGDVDYQIFRRMVRSAAWQHNFLGKPLLERQEVARQMRNQSEAHKNEPDAVYADVDEAWATALLQNAQCQSMIHGHTHKPADHHFGQAEKLVRRVLSDWDAAQHLRAEVLRWHASGQVERINLIAV